MTKTIPFGRALTGRMRLAFIFLVITTTLLALLTIPAPIHAFRSTREFEKGVLMGYILALKNQQ